MMLQVALVALATNPSFHKELLSTVKSWPPALYSSLPVISAIEPQLNTSSMTDSLKEVRLNYFVYFDWGITSTCSLSLVTSAFQASAELYIIDGQYEKAFSLYADVSSFALVSMFFNLLGEDKTSFMSYCVFLCFFNSQLMKPDIFDFIEKHNLHDAIREKVWDYNYYPRTSTFGVIIIVVIKYLS